VGRIVYTSSVAAVGSSPRRDVLRTEEDWNVDLDNVYVRAKTESERAAHRISRETGVPLTVVCPGAVLGAFDYRITPSTRFVKDWVNGTGVSWEGSMNFVAASDVAMIHVLAAEKGRPGARYLAVGDNIHVPDVRPLFKRLTGSFVMRSAFVPYSLQYSLTAAMELAAHLTGGTPLFSRSMLKVGYRRYQSYDNTRTSNELGHTHRPFEDVLRETIAWLLHLGAIRKRVAARILPKFSPDPSWTPPGRGLTGASASSGDG
jgi:dihydroflavonol-4-reductase